MEQRQSRAEGLLNVRPSQRFRTLGVPLSDSLNDPPVLLRREGRTAIDAERRRAQQRDRILKLL